MGKSKDLATGAAYQDQTESDTRYVNASGDTMSGALNVNGGNLSVNSTSEAAHRYLYLNTGATNDGHILFQRGGAAKYQISSDTSNNLFTWNYTKNGTSFRINADGSIIMPHQPSFSAHRDAGHVSAGNVFVFDHTNYNIGNMYNTSNGKATVPVDGRYFLSVWLMTNNQNAWNNKYFRIRINNVSPAYRNVYSSNGGNYHHQISWAGVIDLNANDFVEIYIDNFEAYGSNSLYSNFSMHLLS